MQDQRDGQQTIGRMRRIPPNGSDHSEQEQGNRSLSVSPANRQRTRRCTAQDRHQEASRRWAGGCRLCCGGRGRCWAAQLGV